MKTHCRQWVCGHCDCLVISLIFRLTTFDVRIRRQKSSKSANRVFYISLNKGYFGKTIFSRLFSARYHILKIDWDISEKRVKMMTKMPRDLWKRIVDCGLVAIVTVLSFLSFFVWRLLTSESDVKSHQKVQIGCFTSPSIRGILEKQSFLVYFQLGIIS